jgi:hypothetical protein
MTKRCVASSLYVIGNLSSREATKFADNEPKILDVADKDSLEADPASTAYAARQTANPAPRRCPSARRSVAGTASTT